MRLKREILDLEKWGFISQIFGLPNFADKKNFRQSENENGNRKK